MIEKLLAYGNNNGCSDVHISTNDVPMLRVDGEMIAIPGLDPLKADQVSLMIESVMSEDQKERFEEDWELDFSLQIENMRFRVNAFRTIDGPAAVFREIPIDVRTLEELKTPDVIKKLTKHRHGLILLVGPTGSGKSTTISAMINHIAKDHGTHIITIEDPVEFIHKSAKSLINQREVGTSTHSFAKALKSSLREDPDVILVGEMRDAETTKLALNAAETGHLVFATLHTNSASQSINRIIDIFSAEDKGVIRSMISNSMVAVVSQRLINKKEGEGRIAAYEVMVANTSIRNLIRENKIPQINSAMQLGKKEGMCLLSDSIKELSSKDLISEKAAAEALEGYHIN